MKRLSLERVVGWALVLSIVLLAARKFEWVRNALYLAYALAVLLPIFLFVLFWAWMTEDEFRKTRSLRGILNPYLNAVGMIIGFAIACSFSVLIGVVLLKVLKYAGL